MVCRLAGDAGVHRPRRPHESDFHRLVREDYPAFRKVYAERYARTYGFWRPAIEKAVAASRKCGDLHEGFARVRCPDCRHEFLVAFSCKQRSICPSCHQKRALLFGLHVAEDLCRPVPHRQFVWTLPKRLRLYFRFHRRLRGQLPRLAWESVQETYQAVLGQSARPGAVIAVQTFGQLIHFHPHLHGLITDGAFTPDGAFRPLPEISHEPFLRLWEQKVFRLLLDEGLITPALVRQIGAWRHSGFGVDRRVRLEAGDHAGIERIAQYMARCPFSLARILRITPDGKVLYRAEKDRCHTFPKPASPDLYGAVARNFQIFDPLDFLAELTQHIPDKSEHPIRCYGAYSNKARAGTPVAQPPSTASSSSPLPIPTSSPPSAGLARRRWAALIQRIYHTDPLLCPRCGATMKIIACIESCQRDVIEAILRCCGLGQASPPRAPPAAAPPSPPQPTIESDPEFLEHLRFEHMELAFDAHMELAFDA